MKYLNKRYLEDFKINLLTQDKKEQIEIIKELEKIINEVLK